MTKQFTIPCQFGGQTSPVTFYIGHPDPAHHPIKFQSDWLSSAKGGTVPQDLMMTLQKLHELALENNADFEELCYYSLVSATNNSSDGVSPDEITVWLTQNDLAKLYETTIPNISMHLANIYESKELDKDSTIKKNLTVASNGKTYNY